MRSRNDEWVDPTEPVGFELNKTRGGEYSAVLQFRTGFRGVILARGVDKQRVVRRAEREFWRRRKAWDDSICEPLERFRFIE